MQRHRCVQVMEVAVGPNGGVEGRVNVDEVIALANRVVESRDVRMHCSTAVLLTSGGQEVVRLWR